MQKLKVSLILVIIPNMPELPEFLRIQTDEVETYRKGQALRHFKYGPYANEIYDFWDAYSPLSVVVALEVCRQAGPDLVSFTGATIEEREHVATLLGPVFEGFGDAYLTVSLPDDSPWKMAKIGSKFPELTKEWENHDLIITGTLRRGNFFIGKSVRTKDGKNVAVPDVLFYEEQDGEQLVRALVETNVRAIPSPMPPTRNFVNILKEYRKAVELLGKVMFGPSRDPNALTYPADSLLVQLVREGFYDKQFRDAEKRGWRVRRIPFTLTDVIDHTVSLLNYRGGYSS